MRRSIRETIGGTFRLVARRTFWGPEDAAAVQATVQVEAAAFKEQSETTSHRISLDVFIAFLISGNARNPTDTNPGPNTSSSSFMSFFMNSGFVRKWTPLTL